MKQTAALAYDLEAGMGIDFIGVGVGAAIFNDEGKFLMGLRGPKARNEQGTWEMPGGKVEFGETLRDAVKREIKEEIGVDVEVGELLHVSDNLILEDKQHWISLTFKCRIESGTPSIQEPEKCTKLGWFTLEEALKLPLYVVTQADIKILEEKTKSVY